MSRSYAHQKVQKNKVLRELVFNKSKGICSDCGRKMVLESKGQNIPNPYDFNGDATEYTNSSNSRVFSMDHIKPISKGGRSIASNIRGICISCNKKKKDKYDG